MLVLVAVGAVVLGLGDQPKIGATATSCPPSARERAALYGPQGDDAEAARESVAVLERAAERLAAIRNRVVKERSGSDCGACIWWPFAFTTNLRPPVMTLEQRDLARAAVREAMQSDAMAMLADLAGRESFIAELPPDVLMVIGRQRGFSDVHGVSEFQSARLWTAVADGDWPQVLTSLRETRQLLAQIRASGFDQATDFAELHVQPPFLSNIRALAAQGEAPADVLGSIAALLPPAPERLGLWIERQRLMSEDAADYVARLGEPGRASLIDYNTPDRANVFKGPPRPTGPRTPEQERTFRELMTALDAYYARLIAATLPASANDAVNAVEELAALADLELELPLHGLFAHRPSRVAVYTQARDADYAGTRTIVALERYKLEFGSYPDELALLMPQFLDELPADPYTGRPLGYRPPSAGPFPGQRPYVLYAAGPDRVDNGGKCDFARPGTSITWSTNNRPVSPGDALMNRELPSQYSAK